MICRNLTKMLWITLIRLRNGALLSIYEHVTHFAAHNQHKARYANYHDVTGVPDDGDDNC